MNIRMFSFYKKYEKRLKDVIRFHNIFSLFVIAFFVALFITLYSEQKDLAESVSLLSEQLSVQSEKLQQTQASLGSLQNIQDELVVAVSQLQENSGITEETLSSIKTGIEERRETEEAQNITLITKEWSSRIARISCDTADSEGNTTNAKASGVAMYIGSSMYVMTNKHVLEEDDEDLVKCEVEFPQHGISDIEVQPSEIVISDDRDLAYVRINDSRAYIRISSDQRACSATPEIGDRVIALGFPRVGAEDSITLTDGIISGLEEDFYITTTKIEKGNSGGAAILTKNNCFVGLPTLVVVGRIESLARILPIKTLTGMEL